MYMQGGTVVHFAGDLGENPFEGMTGGTVFKLDPLGKIEEKEGLIIRRSLSASEEIQIKSMLVRHIVETESTQAQAILDHWDLYKDKWAVVTAKKPEKTSAKSGPRDHLKTAHSNGGLP